MSNTITIELCAEDRKRIDELIGFVGLIVSKMNNPRLVSFSGNPDGTMNIGIADSKIPEESTASPDTPKAETHETAPQPAEEVTAQPEPEPVTQEPELPKYTKADVQAKVQSLAGPNNPKREQVKAIVKSYGAKVSDIPEEKYTEVMAQLIALEG